MQSWNHQPELVRQLRGGLGARQVRGRGGRAVRARRRGQVQEHHLHEGGLSDGDRASDPLDGPVCRAVLGLHAEEGAAAPEMLGLRQVPLAARAHLRPVPVRRVRVGRRRRPRQGALVDDLPPQVLRRIPGAAHRRSCSSSTKGRSSSPIRSTSTWPTCARAWCCRCAGPTARTSSANTTCRSSARRPRKRVTGRSRSPFAPTTGVE